MNVTMTEYSIDNDDNQDIIWPTIAGIFVTLALGWMICRYKCSSKEQSPHVVQCCPNSLCKKIRSCFQCKSRHESPRSSNPDSRMSMNSRGSTMEVNNSRLIQATFLINEQHRLSIQPKRHPLRRESLFRTQERTSSSWPFPTTNIDFHEQTNEIKKNDLFLST